MRSFMLLPIAMLTIVAVLFTASLWAGYDNIILPITSKTMFSSESVDPSTTTTSTAVCDSLMNSLNQSIYYDISGTGGSPDVSIRARISVDGTNYATPTVGSVITTVTSDGTGVAPLAIPVCSKLKIELVNNSSTVTATCSVAILTQ